MCIYTLRNLMESWSIPHLDIDILVKNIFKVDLQKGDLLELEHEQTYLASIDHGLVGEFFDFAKDYEICASLFTPGTVIPYKKIDKHLKNENMRYEALTDTSIFVIPRKNNELASFSSEMDILIDRIYDFFISYSRELALLRTVLSAEYYIEFFILIYCTSNCSVIEKNFITVDLLSRVTGCTRQYANKVVYRLEVEGVVIKKVGKIYILNKDILLQRIDKDLFKRYYKPCCITA